MKLNLTSKFLSLFVVAALTLTSCGNDDDDNPQPGTGVEAACKLTNIMYGDSEGDESNNVVEYNAKGLISKVTYSYSDGEEEIEGYTTFTYDSNDRLVKEEEFENGELYEYRVYTYSNGVLSKREEFDAENVSDGVETFKYDASKRIIEITESYDGETYKTTFTYNSQGNISKSEGFYEGELEYTDIYSGYDNKNTPFSAVKGFIEPWMGSSKNNPGKITTTFEMDGEEYSYEVDYSYTYNDKGFPTRVIETFNGEEYETNYTYQCK